MYNQIKFDDFINKIKKIIIIVRTNILAKFTANTIYYNHLFLGIRLKEYCGNNNRPCITENTKECVNEKNFSVRCVCKPGFSGKKCENNDDKCRGVQCQNGGTCENKKNGYQCKCRSGFSGKKCEKNDDKCRDVQCQNGGTCENKRHGYQCKCRSGFKGRFCDEKKRNSFSLF